MKSIEQSELRERWLNDIAGSLGCVALFFTSVALESDTPSGLEMSISGLCLLAAANFVGGALDKGGQLSAGV
jgi:hypothetical protein